MRLNPSLHCTYCAKIPVFQDKDVEMINQGKTINDIMSLRFSEEAKGSSMSKMGQMLDDLNDMFGYSENEGEKDITEQDTHTETVFYFYQDSVYIQFKYNHYRIFYCPFCGNPINLGK